MIGVIKIWNANTGQGITSAKLSGVWVSCLKFSPDSKRVAITGNLTRLLSGEVRILNAETGREVLSLHGHTLDVKDVAFSPDNQRLATASVDRTIRLWDLSTGQEILKFAGHTAPLSGIRFVSNGRRLISVSFDRTIRTWDATIVLHFIDGVRGDEDLTANGIIVDAGGPGFADPFTVTTTADSGDGSLRQAILNANANPGLDVITFDIPGAGPYTIQPLSPLPAITDSVIIDGLKLPSSRGGDDNQRPRRSSCSTAALRGPGPTVWS